MFTQLQSTARMAVLLLIAAFSVLVTGTDTCAQELIWSNSYGGEYNESGYGCHQIDDSSYVALGATFSFGQGDFDIYLITLNIDGDTLWSKTYGGSGTDYGYDIQQTYDSGFVIVGSTNSFGTGKRDVYVIKTNPQGSVIWTKTYGGSENDEAWSVQQTPDSGFIVCGTTDSYGPGYSDVYLLKLDASGDTVWTRAYGGVGGDLGYTVRRTSDGGYIIAGSTGSFGEGYSSVYAIRTDSFGDTLWTSTYGGSAADFGYSVELALDGGFVFVGNTSSFGAGYSDVYLVKTDADGNQQWQQTYGGTMDERAYAVSVGPDGGYLIAGSTESYGSGRIDAYIVKTDPLGVRLWAETYGGSKSDFARAIMRDALGHYILVGHSYSYTSSGSNMYVVKIQADAATGIFDDYADLLPDAFELRQNYPNPFNNSTIIEYTLNTPSAVRLSIYNVLGQIVREWHYDGQSAGIHSVHWDGTGDFGTSVATGVYLYRLETDTFARTRKMILLK